MGYFLDINNNDSLRAKNTAQINAANGQNGYTLLGVIASQCGPSIFMGILNRVATSSDGKGGANDSTKEVDLNAQKKTLESQLKKALSVAGVDSVKNDSDVENVKNNAEKNRQNNLQNSEITKNIQKFQDNTDEYSVNINNLKAQLNSTTITDDEKANINKQITKLEEQKTKAFNKLQKEFSELVKTEDKKLQDIVFNAEQAKNIYIQLQNLKAVNDADKIETSYDAGQEVSDLSNFNKARTAFLKNKNANTAKALADAYEAVDSSKAKEAYEKYLKTDVEYYLDANKQDIKDAKYAEEHRFEMKTYSQYVTKDAFVSKTETLENGNIKKTYIDKDTNKETGVVTYDNHGNIVAVNFQNKEAKDAKGNDGIIDTFGI